MSHPVSLHPHLEDRDLPQLGAAERCEVLVRFAKEPVHVIGAEELPLLRRRVVEHAPDTLEDLSSEMLQRRYGKISLGTIDYFRRKNPASRLFENVLAATSRLYRRRQ
jgi:hypothetical protein